MLLTRASEYAIISLVYIAKQKAPIDVDTMSNELKIPKSFLAKILQNLAKNDLLKSYKGINGGFLLSKEPSKINIKDVIIAAEKKEPLVFECGSNEGCPSDKHDECMMYPIVNKLQSKINIFLENITLEQLLN